MLGMRFANMKAHKAHVRDTQERVLNMTPAADYRIKLLLL